MRQDARENRERILAAAEKVFGAHGGAGSTEEVDRRAGVGIATVFRHFATKEDLIEAALLRISISSPNAPKRSPSTQTGPWRGRPYCGP
ncbi:TetR/AcrR family transcriptional regulator [Nocardia flavorosea]|uniref:TetR/AcrR family transcriptional regulator n=1 Tax=Nocardia flavorosea TaxID=53429 RepID=UPI000AD4E72C|nr:helix-turn-helix domain-containing protein [Nocardia flavorosea]